MKRIKAILPLCAVLLLAGCGSSGDSAATSGQLEYDTFENVMAELDDLSAVGLENITLAEGIMVNRPERLVTMTIANRLPDEAAAGRLAEAFFPNSGFKAKEASALSDYLLREDTAGGGMISLEGYGFFGFAYSERDWLPQYDQEGKVFLNADRDSLSLKLRGGELDLDRALDLAREAADKYAEALGMEPLVPTIAKYNSSGFMIRFAHSLGGWLLPDQPIETNGSENTEMIRAATHHEVRCCVASTERAGMFAGDGCICCQSEAEQDRMVTLSSALRYLDENLSIYMGCTVRQISLVQLSTARSTEVQDASSFSDAELRAKLEGGSDTSPAWQFNITDDRGEYIAFIDCLTGEFAFGRLMTGA
ncbi:MAG: hypothetical protein IJ746_06170 [Ruminococcus sp.]|nr:hypothetical protein [Ruminococcus sp.]